MAEAKKTAAKKTTSRGRRRTRPGDATGRKDEELREQLTEDQKAEAARLSMATAAEAEEKAGVVDYAKGAPPIDDVFIDDDDDDIDDDALLAALDERVKDDPVLARLAERFARMKRATTADVEDVNVVEGGGDTKIFLAAEDIEAMTYGAGNHMSFEAGRRYRVPVEVYDHLDSKGLVYH